MGYILFYLIIELLFAAAAAAILPRRAAWGLAGILLLLGVGLPIALWSHAAAVGGDTSAQGMLGTICVILFLPAGLALAVFACFKSA